MQYSIILLLVTATVVQVSAQCESGCYGRGQCNSEAKCDCFPGYSGAECAEKRCPVGPVWSGRTSGDEQSRPLVECSNAGRCDVRTGECKCNPGFFGSNCGSIGCARSCSDSGKCMTVSAAAQKYGWIPFESHQNYGVVGGLPSSDWGDDHLKMCVCDAGRAGPDCSASE